MFDEEDNNKAVSGHRTLLGWDEQRVKQDIRELSHRLVSQPCSPWAERQMSRDGYRVWENLPWTFWGLGRDDLAPFSPIWTSDRSMSMRGVRRTFGGRHGNPVQYSCLDILMDRGAWLSTVHGIAESWIRLSDQGQCSPGRMWLTQTGPSSSAANEWPDDTGGIETEVHGRTSRGNVYQKGLIELVLVGFQVRVPMHCHKRCIREPRGYWSLPRNSAAIYTEYAVSFPGSGRPGCDECRWSCRTEVSSSASLDQQQRSPPELAISPRGEQEERPPESESKLNVIECYTW